jgi:hypothetical protein
MDPEKFNHRAGGEMSELEIARETIETFFKFDSMRLENAIINTGEESEIIISDDTIFKLVSESGKKITIKTIKQKYNGQ